MSLVLRWLTTEYSENLLFWSFKHFFLNHLNQILNNESYTQVYYRNTFGALLYKEKP